METRQIPVARGLPLLGVALKFGPLWAREARARHGDVFAFQLPGGNGGVMVCHPDDVRTALVEKEGVTRPAFKSEPDNLLAKVTGDGLFALGGQPWVERRAMMQPSFRRQRLAALVPLMLGEIDQAIDSLDRRFVREGRAFDVQPEMNSLALNVLIRSLFSDSMNSRDFKATCEAVELTMQSISFDPFKLGKRGMYERASRSFDEVGNRLIVERRRLAPAERPADLLTAMLEMRDPQGRELQDSSIKFELTGFLIAGKETSAITLSWLLALLPQMPEVERRLVEEIDSVVGGAAPTADHLPKLEYTRMVLQETLRRHAPVWILVPRRATEDVVLGGHAVREGTQIWVSPFVTHHHPEIWERADEFLPERFADEGNEASERHRYAYLPFGSGPRVCLGNRFAMMELQLTVARLLQRYRVRWAGSGPWKHKVIFNTYLPKEVPIQLIPRA